MKSIHQRDFDPSDRIQPGPQEGDLLIGTGNRSAIATLVERVSRLTLLVHLPGDKTSKTVTTQVTKAKRRLPPGMRRSLTWDRGTEMADHEKLTKALGFPVYFCDAS